MDQTCNDCLCSRQSMDVHGINCNCIEWSDLKMYPFIPCGGAKSCDIITTDVHILQSLNFYSEMPMMPVVHRFSLLSMIFSELFMSRITLQFLFLTY